MRLQAVPFAGFYVLDVAFAVDAEVDVEAALWVVVYPRPAPAVSPQNVHRDIEDIGVAGQCPPGLLETFKEIAPVSVRAHAVRYRIGNGGEVAECRCDGQVVGLPGRLAEVAAAARFPRFLRRPFPV